MSQILNVSTAINNRTDVHIPKSKIVAIKSVQILHKCNEPHNKVIKVNTNLLENEENYGTIGHIFTNSKLDINEDIIYTDYYTDTINLFLTDQNDLPVNLHENIYISMTLLVD